MKNVKSAFCIFSGNYLLSENAVLVVTLSLIAAFVFLLRQIA